MLDGKFHILDSDEDSSDEDLYGSKANKSGNNQNKKQREYKRNLKKAKKEEEDDELGNLNDNEK